MCGLLLGEGDGTVALLSLGAMCVEGWKRGTRWNPHGVKVITQEASGPMTSLTVTVLMMSRVPLSAHPISDGA